MKNDKFVLNKTTEASDFCESHNLKDDLNNCLNVIKLIVPEKTQVQIQLSDYGGCKYCKQEYIVINLILPKYTKNAAKYIIKCNQELVKILLPSKLKYFVIDFN